MIDDSFGEGSPDQDQDVSYGGSGDLGSAGGITGGEDMSPGTKALLEKIQEHAAQKPPGVSDEAWEAAGKLPPKTMLRSEQPDILTSKSGYFRINPNATFFPVSSSSSYHPAPHPFLVLFIF